jgi:hypothetical protein
MLILKPEMLAPRRRQGMTLFGGAAAWPLTE